MRTTVKTLTDQYGLTGRVQQVAGPEWDAIARIPVLRTHNATRAGAYVRQRNRVTGEIFNERIHIDAALKPEDLPGTLTHELAHALEANRDPMGNSAHGPVWQAIARDLGCPENHRHAVAKGLSYLRVNGTYQYRCMDCGKVCHKFRRPKWDAPIGMMVNQMHTSCRHKTHGGRLVRIEPEKVQTIETQQEAA